MEMRIGGTFDGREVGPRNGFRLHWSFPEEKRMLMGSSGWRYFGFLVSPEPWKDKEILPICAIGQVATQ